MQFGSEIRTGKSGGRLRMLSAPGSGSGCESFLRATGSAKFFKLFSKIFEGLSEVRGREVKWGAEGEPRGIPKGEEKRKIQKSKQKNCTVLKKTVLIAKMRHKFIPSSPQIHPPRFDLFHASNPRLSAPLSLRSLG